ncbi:hypothetical protein [Actinokineospora bangkokensis]|uniref:Uncharacterized protein n=1 Tax=Actinokineospora bangkokensis TaxID=1193682 RepID=A0A1Q9LPS1_9PSEU|nr:hypothetical protein [Actinokineospora bangkokensis]OLR94019.1 hypothetical protein BJP25_13665 [Actinokineospora bangkokensis]
MKLKLGGERAPAWSAVLLALSALAGCRQSYEASASLLRVNTVVGLGQVGDPVPADRGRFTAPPVEGRVTSVAVVRTLPAEAAAQLDMETDWDVIAPEGHELVVIRVVREESDDHAERITIDTAGGSRAIDPRTVPDGDPVIVVVASVPFDDPVWLTVEGDTRTTRYDIRHLAYG